MKKGILFLFAVCAVTSALSNADDSRLRVQNKPSATVSSASEYGFTTHASISTKPSTTATTPMKTTTSPNTTTTTPKTTTTTPKTTTTTPKTTTTTPKTTTTTPKTTTTTPKTTTTTPKTTTTTPKTTTTTPKTTTTTPKTTTTTPKTTTTTPMTTTTTPKTTTTTPKTTTTTPKTTTTTPMTTTPPKPTPSANLTVGNYSFTEKGVTCLMAQMALQIRSTTPKANGTFIVQPKLTKVEGGCKAPTANLTLTFLEGTINFMFYKNTTENAVYVDTVAFNLNYPFNLTPGAKNSYSAVNKSVHLFVAKIGHSYSCKSESLYMGNGLYLDVSQDRMQAFNLTANKSFGVSDLCKADQPDYRAAIAVGIVLLILIIVVVVAYLLGRRRRADGYQSL